MVVDDLYIVRVAFMPSKTKSPLIVDANAVLSFTISSQRLEMVSRWAGQIRQNDCTVHLAQFPLRNPLDCHKAADSLSPIKAFSVLTTKGFNHTSKV